MVSKITAAAAAKDASEAGCDACESSPGAESTSSLSSSSTNATGSSSSSGTNATPKSSDEPVSRSSGDGETDSSDARKPKGHGRNGASAYRQAQRCDHALAPGVIGALCEKCKRAKMSRYREKVVLRIVGQPLFKAEVHHHEQGRCRGCGHIVRAQSPGYVSQGLGTDYIRYDWSACAMLMVMHYFSGAPFKRIESLHEGWGVPMPDANQWEVVNAGDDLLLPLYRALERHAIQKATNFRIDDTGAHALLKFRDIKDKHPVEYAEAGRVYKQVFDNDDEAKALGLSPVERMLYHREHSKPLLRQLKKMCEEKITSKRVEPSSRLWEPLTFILNQWDRLTRFCDVPGVPLDTNLVEQALILPVRYFAGSFNYHTADGAVVGDHAMSLIATARANEVEPVAWLTECLRCHEDLAPKPEHYLPWVYRERLEAGDASDASPRAPPRETPRRGPEPAPARSLRDLSPELGKRAARRIAAPDQHLQLAGEQR